MRDYFLTNLCTQNVLVLIISLITNMSTSIKIFYHSCISAAVLKFHSFSVPLVYIPCVYRIDRLSSLTTSLLHCCSFFWIRNEGITFIFRCSVGVPVVLLPCIVPTTSLLCMFNDIQSWFNSYPGRTTAMASVWCSASFEILSIILKNWCKYIACYYLYIRIWWPMLQPLM